MSASRKRQSPHSRTRCTSIYATQDTTPACFCFPGYSTVIKNHASAMYWFKPLTFACHRIPAALVSILPVIAFIILTRPIHACSHYSFRSAANKAGRAGNWILEFSAYPGVCILSTRVRMWRMLIRHRRTRVSESKQTTDM